MSKRQEARARRRRQQMMSRLLVIGMVILGALLIACALALPSIDAARVRATQQAGLTMTPVSTGVPRTVTAPSDKTSVGDPAAPVRVDVWEDFQCPACQYYSQDIETLIIQNYVETGKVYYTYHFFTSISSYTPGNTESEHSANAAMCASDQGRFWDYHDILYANWNGENAGAFADYRLVAFAEALGLDMKEFNTCFESDKYADFVAEDYQAGKDWGVQGTPAIFVNGVMVVSPRGERYVATYEEIVVYIEAALAGE
ncbi:MAG: DSBA oxidoreductase [Anaerolineaceae bacterium]|nr:MAG: DSBA oxidoreductase [Anaerolineaceae bacterium]